VDFSSYPTSRKTRSLHDVTSVAYQENYRFLTPYPEEESRLTAVIRPFNFVVSLATSSKGLFYFENILNPNLKNVKFLLLNSFYVDVDGVKLLDCGICHMF